MDNIVIVDDEPDVLKSLVSILEMNPEFTVKSAAGGPEAIDLFKSEPVDLMITDIKMPGMDGFELIEQVRSLDEEIEIIVLTGYGTIEFAVQALKEHRAYDFITKPVSDIREFIITIEKALERRRLCREKKEYIAKLRLMNEKLKQEIEERKLAEASLRESEAKARGVLNAISDSVLLTDARGMMFAINQAACQSLGRTVEELVGANIYDILPPELGKTRKAEMDKVICSGKMVRFQDRWDDILFDNWLYPVFNGNSNVRYMVMYSRDITDENRTRELLRKQEAELEHKTLNLEQANTALNIVMRKTEEDKTDIQEKVLFNVEKLVFPYLQRLKTTTLNDRQKVFMEIMESNLNDIVSPFARCLSHNHLRLTPSEIQVADFVKQGKTAKEIAQLLNLSVRTVEKHKDNMRGKMGLKNKKVNLRSHLLSMEN